MVYAQLLLTYPKGHVLYIRLTYGKHILYNIIIPEFFMSFYVLCDCVIISIIYDIILILTLFFS